VLSHSFEPVILAIPRHLTGKLEQAEVYHQVLEHRWYLSEAAGGDVPMAEAVQDYMTNVLAKRRDEEALIMPATTDNFTLPTPVPTGTITVIDDDDIDWRDLV